jgi:hypothetical protein
MLMTVTVRVKLHMTDYELYREYMRHVHLLQNVHFVLLEMKINNASPLVSYDSAVPIVQ